MPKFLNIYARKKPPLKCVFFILLALCFLVPVAQTAFASSTDTSDIEQQLSDEIYDSLKSLDLGDIEKLLSSLTEDQLSLFGSSSFWDKILSIINGDYSSSDSFLSAICSILWGDIADLLPTIATIIAIAIFGSLIQSIRPISGGKGMQDVIHFVTFGLIVVVLLSQCSALVTLVKQTLTSLQAQMDAIFPLLLTILTALGGTTSVAVYQPAMAVLSGSIISIFTYVLLPIFIFSTVFSVVSNLSPNVSLDKFTSFLNSCYKWLLGLVFTIFSAFLSIQGIAAGAADGISIKTAKYAIRSYVPILGSYLSDGISLLLASSTLIKNAVGTAGLLLLLATILSPLLKIIFFMLALKLMAAVIQPLGSSQLASFVSSLAKSMVLLIVLLIGVAFVYFLLLGLVICSANVA